MLSLKHQAPPVATRRITILDLPQELLEAILGYVYTSEYDHNYNLFSACLVCKRFRAPAAALMFETIELTLEGQVTRHGQNLIDFLTCQPDIAALVRSVVIRDVVDHRVNRPGQTCHRFEELFPLLKNLRTVQIQELNVKHLFVIDLIMSSARPVHLIVDHALCSLQQATDRYSLQEYLRLPMSSQLSIGVALGLNPYAWGSVGPVLLKSPHLKALNFRNWLNDSIRMAVPPLSLDYDGLLRNDGAPRLQGPLEELHMNDVILNEHYVTMGICSFFQAINWSGIRRMALTGRAMVGDFFPRAAHRLSALESLRLNSPNPQSYLFAVGMVGSAYDNSIPVDRQSSPDDSPFLKLPMLRDLELDGVSSALPLSYISYPLLEKVKIHLQERLFTVKTQGVRSAEEVRRFASRMPFITHLELDIGPIGNLWHPTAIPGVEVDVHVYQVLDALTAFRNLRFLRLFPPYIVRGTQRNREPIYRQPLSDEQAIKIFRHVRLRLKSLQALAISADGTVAKEAHSFYAASWEVSMLGDKTLLKTRQAKRNYEQVQVWEGERRLTSQSKTLAYPRPYLPNSEAWVLSD